MEVITLADGGLVLFDPHFLPPSYAEGAFVELLEQAAWAQQLGPFRRPQPRLTAAYGDEGVTYRYSGADNPALPWLPRLLEIKARVEAVAGEYNYCLLNRYRSGADAVGWHADDEPGLGPVIGSVSLGAARAFRIRHNASREVRSFELGGGALLVMAGTMQQHWKHEAPRTPAAVGQRINLTFRHVGLPPAG